MRDEKNQSLPSNFDKELELRCDAGYKLYSDIRKVVQHHAVESAITSWEIIGALETMKTDLISQLSATIDPEDTNEQE
jgi:predicted DNA-binding protein with PD1-like motif